MRNMNNERGQLCPATSLTHCHTATVSYWTFCRQPVSLLFVLQLTLPFDNNGAVLPSKLKMSLFNDFKLRCDFGRGRDAGCFLKRTLDF